MTDPKRPDDSPLLSPLRPKRPNEPEPSPPPSPSLTTGSPTNPVSALESIRRKMEVLNEEFAQGKLNHTQFTALYDRYLEQRQLIEKLMERNPDSSVWKRAALSGSTMFLRQQYEARLLYYLVFLHQQEQPLQTGGQIPADLSRVHRLVSRIWENPARPKAGVGRKDWGDEQWVILALGDHAVTVACFIFEPSPGQIRLVGDLHSDFERANSRLLQHGTQAFDQFVFPQRALTQ